MIITQKKPAEELLAMLEGVAKVAIVGCGQCAAACQTGGEKEIAEMKPLLPSPPFFLTGSSRKIKKRQTAPRRPPARIPEMKKSIIYASPNKY